MTFLNCVMPFPKDQSRHKSKRSHHQDEACWLWCNRYRRSSASKDRRRPGIIYRRKHWISRGRLWRNIRRCIVRDDTRLARSAEHARHRSNERRQFYRRKILGHRSVIHWNLADEVDLRHGFILRGAIVRMGFIPSRPSRQCLRAHLVVNALRQLVFVVAKKVLAVR